MAAAAGGRPRFTCVGHVFPVMTDDEVRAISLPLEEALEDGKLLAVLQREGVALVTGVLTPAQCAEYQRLFGEDLAEVRDVKSVVDVAPDSMLAQAIDRTAVPPQDLPHVWPHGTTVGSSGFAIRHGLPHGRCAWAGRMNESVRQLYSKLYSVDPTELCVGCDNMFFTPPSVGRRSDTTSLWPHVDQNAHCVSSGDWFVMQSVLYVWSAQADGMSTTIVWPRSHKEVYPKLMADRTPQQFGPADVHFIEVAGLQDAKLSEELKSQFKEHGRRVPVPEGSLLLWNSRTVHQGHGGGERLAIPLCWEPKSRRSDAALWRKARLCVSGVPSTHWAALGFQHDMAPREHMPRKAVNVSNTKGWQAAGIPLKACLMPQGLRPECVTAAAALLAESASDESALGKACLSLLKPEVVAVL